MPGLIDGARPLALALIACLALAACGDSARAVAPSATANQASPPSRPTPGAAPKLTPRPAGERFLLFAPGDTAADRPGETYEQRALRAASAHLAGRLGIAPDQVSLVEATTTEVPTADPCSAGGGSGPAPGGLTPARELILQAGSARYRYLAVGGVGHSCGETPASP